MGNWGEITLLIGATYLHLHPRKLTCPLKRDYFNRKYIFQPSIFNGHVSFPGRISGGGAHLLGRQPSSGSLFSPRLLHEFDVVPRRALPPCHDAISTCKLLQRMADGHLTYSFATWKRSHFELPIFLSKLHLS